MKKHELLGIVRANAAKRQQVLMDKNHDYAGEGDALKNFKLVEYLGVCSSEVGCLVRMCDKISRMATLLHSDPKVTGESFDDTNMDLANYCDILDVIRKEKQR